MDRVLLIVPPFHQLFIPAIGVSLLKAALAQRDIPCDILYLNIQFAERVGPELYTQIAVGGRHPALVGEWVFAEALFGSDAPDADAYVEEVLLGRYDDAYDRAFVEQLGPLRDAATAFLDDVMHEVDWDRYAIVGITSTFQQNCAGLALLQRLRALHPNIRTVMGGANCEGPMGGAIFDLFPFVDFVCSGEADEVFPDLARRIIAGQPTGGLLGVFARGNDCLLGDNTHTPMIFDMDRLPYPDYEDYFAQFLPSSLATLETPLLPFQTSRGCWWGAKHHCKFCGLNGGGMDYRSKSPERAIEEIDFLLERYGVRSMYSVDAILDVKYFDTVIAELASRPRPPRLFYETKSNLTKQQLRLLARAGVRFLQPGIESLSTPTLQLMDKGVSGLHNVRTLKWCAEIGILPDWNCLYGFPGEDPAEYEKLAGLFPSLAHLQPPAAGGQIRLDRFSPYFNGAPQNGMINARATIAYRHVYPFPAKELDRLAYDFDYEYADGRSPERYTASLRQAIADWRTNARSARLEMRDDGKRLQIRDTRPVARSFETVLSGPRRAAYLALDEGKSAAGVREQLHSLSAANPSLGEPSLAEIQGWLDAWLEGRLVMREGARYLSLATDVDGRVELPVERFLSQLAAQT